jgi:hypothetical protein
MRTIIGKRLLAYARESGLLYFVLEPAKGFDGCAGEA